MHNQATQQRSYLLHTSGYSTWKTSGCDASVKGLTPMLVHVAGPSVSSLRQGAHMVRASAVASVGPMPQTCYKNSSATAAVL